MARSSGGPRDANRRRVVEALLDYAGTPVTHPQLSRDTGLAVGTVSTIVREFAGVGMVQTTQGAGRRGGTVSLGRGAGLVAGIDFGHSHLAVALADMNGTIIGEQRVQVDSDQDHQENLALARQLVSDLFEGHDAQRRLLRTVGMGLPAPLSSGTVLGSAIMPGWVGVRPAELAAETFGVPVVVDNDANLGALAEHRRGAGQGHTDLVFVKISSGVGCGIVIGGQIFQGAEGMAGELGHLTLDDQGPLCRCGSRGCLEAYTSAGTALGMMSAHLPHASLDEVIEAARAGNVAARRVFEDAGLHLGWGLAAVTNLLNPGIVVVGGDMARAGDLLLESARVGLRRHVLAGSNTTPIVASGLGDRASLLGAITVAIDHTDLLRALS
jgi:predicted NBD/HSP70 family sugar kinase